MPIPGYINDELVRESGRIDDYVYEETRYKSPFSSLMDKGTFEPGMGVVRTAILYDRTVPTNTYDWSNVSVNDGTTNSCVPNTDVISPASTAYTHQLKQKAIRSIDFCWNDLYTAFNAQEQINAIIKNFVDAIVDIWEDSDRDNYIAICGHKCVFSGGTLVDNGSASFALTTPDSYATPDLMDQIYQYLIMDGAGAGDHKVGMVNGQPVFVAYMGYEQHRALIKLNDGVRNDVRWSSKVDMLIEPFAATTTLNGFTHIVDMKAPRYNFTAGAWVRVPYYTTTATTIGDRAIINPDYKTAVYEDIVIYLRDVVERQMPTKITSFGDATFRSPSLAGDPQWLNIPDRFENPLGNIGFFYALLQASYRPRNPRLGYTIRVRRCPNQLGRQTCSGS